VKDPPEHTRLRTLVSKAFTPRAIGELEPRIESIVEELLSGLRGRKRFELISEFAYPLPITVIAEMLGVDADRRDFFRTASQKIAVSLGPITDPATIRLANEGRTDLLAYFEELIARRRLEPRADMVSALLRAEDDGRFLSHGELLGMLLLLLVGGHETTVNLIANGMLALMRNPRQFALLASNGAMMKRAIEELLRYDAPVQYTGRVARRDVEVGGQLIRAGQPVRLLLAAANRDPDAFEDPEHLNLTREREPNLAFGWGVHVCLGAPLARLEGEIAIGALVRNFPNMQLAEQMLRYRPASVLRGLEALHVTV
jgi:cytochrome P450